MSAQRGVIDVGKRGSGRRETNVGNKFKSCRISGSLRSGEVHTRMYSPSTSSSSAFSNRNGVTSSKVVVGVEDSSGSPTTVVALDRFDGVVATDREGVGVSKNGSLGARARFE